MTYVTWKVERYARTGTTWSASPIVLSDAYDLDVQVSVGTGKDSFAFKIANWNNRYDNYFQAQDKIVISRATNTTTISSGDVLMVGAVKEVPTESSGKADTMRIGGYNYSEAVMSTMTFTDVNGINAPQAIQQALASCSTRLNVTWDATNPTVKKDAVTAFPTITKNYRNVPMSQVLEECSSAQLTGDGAYYWWVDNSNKLKWKSNQSGTAYTFSESTDRHLTIKTSVDTKDIRNYFILKGGRDPAGKSIQIKYIDETSRSAHGTKYYFNTSATATAESLIRQDFGANATTTIPTGSFTTKWRSEQTGTYVTVANGADYVTAIRNEIKYRLNEEALDLAAAMGQGKLKVDLKFVAGTQSWGLFDRVTCTIPRLFTTPKMLRVTEIQYGTPTDVYSLEEDVGSI